MATPKTSLNPDTVRLINRGFGMFGLLCGLVFLLGGGFVIHRFHLDQFLLKPTEAKGQVVENRPHRVSSRSNGLSYTSYQAIVRFTDQRGQVVTHADEFGFSNPSFHVGQTVKVFYDQKNPEHAMIDRGPTNYLVPLVCLVFGGLMVLGSLQRLGNRG